MLSHEDNQLLARVGPNTPGGQVVRHYWLPFLFSAELAGPDCPPLRVRLACEDLVAWRDTEGKLGLMQNACPHRGASMFFGRNEEDGLRCVYHGWKFDVTGECVDMPNEPAESNFKHKIQAISYPCVERNGVVWAYLGQANPAPPLPHMEWNMVPEGHAYVSKRVQYSNWFQAMEGGIDSSHANFLHSMLNPERTAARRTDLGGGPALGFAYMAKDKQPVFETLDEECGVVISARRTVDSKYYWRVNHYLMPFYTLFPPSGGDPPASGHAWVPIDDETTIVFHWTYHPLRPLTENERHSLSHGQNGQDGFHPGVNSLLPANSEPYGAWRPVQRAENDYLLDDEAQRTVRFSGIPGGWAQDSALQETMGAICNRPAEHLGTSDLGIIAARRFYLNVVKRYRDTSAPPPALNSPEAWYVRPAAAVLGQQEDWVSAMRSGWQAHAGTTFVTV